MRRAQAVYHTIFILGAGILSLAGFFSPLWYLGFLPIGACLLWAAYDFDLVEVSDGESPPAPQR